MLRDEALQRLKEHEAELRRLGVQSLYLFGSTARGEARCGASIWMRERRQSKWLCSGRDVMMIVARRQ